MTVRLSGRRRRARGGRGSRRHSFFLGVAAAAAAAAVALVLLLSSSECRAFFAPSSSPSLSAHHRRRRRLSPSSLTSTTSLDAVSLTRTCVLDGAELYNVEAYLAGISPFERKRVDDGSVGYMYAAVGTTVEGGGAGDRVVGVIDPSSSGDDGEGEGGVSLGGGTILYPQSVASVPRGVSDDDAITTLAASLSGVHCALPPKVENVGGDDGTGGGGVWGKAVVLGGGDMAAFAADGLAAMGAEVTIVSTNGNPKVKNKSVTLLPPAAGDDEIGFASVVGTFDSLVDTLDDESGAVLGQLRRQCKCDRYISTLTRSQRTVRDKGVLFGPGAANKYAGEVGRGVPKLGSSPNSKKYRPVIPPPDFGPSTVQTLLEKGVIFKGGDGGGGKDGPFVRTWSLPDFWEYASWPRDSTGDGDVRYGLPVKSEAELEREEEEARELAARARRTVGITRRQQREEREEIGNNPHVTEIDGLGGLREHILDPGADAILFLSAPWCRTCRSLKPKYNRMAREEEEKEHEDEGSAGVTFAKCEAVGKRGKDLSRFLDVEAVPAFVAFRRGRVMGEPMSVSRLPSPEIDRALERLRGEG